MELASALVLGFAHACRPFHRSLREPRQADSVLAVKEKLASHHSVAEAALQNKKNRLAALEKDHRRAMAAVVVDHGEEPVQASVRDDLTDARAMAQARRAELVLSDKRAAADELRTDCASYADALAALQRALGAVPADFSGFLAARHRM